MSSASDSLMLLGWLSISSARPSLLVPVLPPFVNALTTFFRFLALMALLPVLLLAVVDILGWLFFKLVLRPLGYASTIRFKDPEPNVYIQQILSVNRHFARRRKSRSKVPATATSPTPAVANSLSRSRSRSKAGLVDEAPSIPIQVVPPPTDESSASDSSASSSPILSYSNLSPDPTQPATLTPATSAEQSPDSAPPSPELEGRNALGLSPDMGNTSKFGSSATSANSSTSSLVSLGMRRQRAGSVGVDGPLVELEESASSEEEGVDGARSGETSESGEVEDDHRTHGIRRRNLPRGGPAFGFTDLAT